LARIRIVTDPNPFALQNSGLNEFLFSVVGTETNGSPLTVLSMLARCGQDPWTETERWTKLPKASIIDRLTDNISQMPLRPQAPGEARITAARLVLLLPARARAQATGKSDTIAPSESHIPQWFALAGLLAALASGIAFQSIPTAVPTKAAAPVADQAQPPTN
jgi:hypothetical protein